MNKILLLFKTSRPVSWINTAYPFGIGYLLSGAPMNAQFFFSILFFLIPYNLLMYGINDVFDYESDIKNPRKGGVEGAITPKKYHKIILVAGVGGSIFFALPMILLGNRASSAVLFVVLFFVVAYSVKGLRFKEVPILDSISSSIHFVGPLVYALILVNNTNVTAWLLVLAFFCWGMASHAFGAVQDIQPDRKAQISSIATILGGKNTVRIAVVLYALSASIVAAQGGTLIFIGFALISYCINILPFWNISDKQSSSSNKAWRRFMKLNYFVGAVITISVILLHI